MEKTSADAWDYSRRPNEVNNNFEISEKGALGLAQKVYEKVSSSRSLRKNFAVFALRRHLTAKTAKKSCAKTAKV